MLLLQEPKWIFELLSLQSHDRKHVVSKVNKEGKMEVM